MLEDYAEVDLGHGVWSKISLQDIPKVSKIAWHWDADGYAKNSGKGRLQNWVMAPQSGQIIDHISGDRLDNRRENLRYASRTLNALNVNAPSQGKSGVRGVYWAASNNKWAVRVRIDGTKKFIGYFDTVPEAAAAYRKILQERVNSEVIQNCATRL